MGSQLFKNGGLITAPANETFFVDAWLKVDSHQIGVVIEICPRIERILYLWLIEIDGVINRQATPLAIKTLTEHYIFAFSKKRLVFLE